jgi:serine/threonine-protein kinase
MSPEQARGERVGAASDIFSFGVTLYRKLSGDWPFPCRTVVDVLDAIQSAEPRPLCDHGIAPALDAIVSRCLRKRPAERFPSMRALGEALDAFLSGAGPRRRGARRGPAIHPEDFA